nr:multifunctional transcriptional regulator/nicotinamide-nucleotide adenylyltransferase/ribosylnicotinamide kinase NadR [Bacillus tianshenii]
MKTVGFIGGKYLPLHRGHIYTIVRAASSVDELYVILSHNEDRDRETCEKSSFPYIPADIRLRWLHEATKEMGNVRVLSVADTTKDYDWEEGSRLIKAAINKKIDVVFSSESAYDAIFKSNYPDAKHILLDEERKIVPISATEIREEGVYAHWNDIPECVRPYFVKKVVLVGTESCGKSTLTRNLASVYNTTFVKEYGRTLCEEIGGCEGIIQKEDYPIIAYGHKMEEKEAIRKANKIVFIDTEATVTQYYSHLYNNCHQKVLDEIIAEQSYDMYLYLEPDVPWVDDGLRVHGEQYVRDENNKLLKEMFKQNNIELTVISGTYEEKLNQAIDLVDQLFREN